MLKSVPFTLRESWAEVQAEIIEHVKEATTDGERDRALKMLAISPALLLRKPSRMGARGVASLERRFGLWRTGDHAILIKELQKAVDARKAREPSRNDDDESLRKAVLAKLEKGLISDAARLADSNGVADSSNADIQAQMRAKHQQRTHRMPNAVPDQRERIEVKPEVLAETYRTLPRDKGQGPTPWTYEHMTALAPTVPFANERAQRALAMHAWLASALANGELPQWYNYLLAAVRLIPLHKGPRPPG